MADFFAASLVPFNDSGAEPSLTTLGMLSGLKTNKMFSFHQPFQSRRNGKTGEKGIKVKMCPSHVPLEYQFLLRRTTGTLLSSIFTYEIISYFALRTSTKIFLDPNFITESKYSKNCR